MSAGPADGTGESRYRTGGRDGGGGVTATVDRQAPAERPSSWRDRVFAEYETDQARLRVLLADDPEEHL